MSKRTIAHQLGSITDVAFAKCIAWLPLPELEGVIAIGQTNGRVILSSVRGNTESCLFHGREYASKHVRQCHAVAWGISDPLLLAGGFDKHRSEHGVIIWDAGKSETEVAKPIMEAGFGDSVASLAWFTQSQTIVAGVNGKFLRVYDVRGNVNVLILRLCVFLKLL